jgi:ribonuclease VapC
MVIDTSVLVAILLREDGYEDIVFRIAEADDRYLSAGSYLEASIVLTRKRGKALEVELDRAIYEMDIVIVPVSVTHAKIGREAYSIYGKGVSPAGLNLGDCFAYALSKSLGEPLLFRGNDFSKTDVAVA